MSGTKIIGITGFNPCNEVKGGQEPMAFVSPHSM